jgi:hypothetical protein
VVSSNNAEPFDGRCCNDCDNPWVIPARQLMISDPAMLETLRQVARLSNELAR